MSFLSQYTTVTKAFRGVDGSQAKVQTPWEETDEEYARRRDKAQSQEVGWTGTIVGIALAAAAGVILFLNH